MCSNFQPIKRSENPWVISKFNCSLPSDPYREEAYPTYPAPFIYLDNGIPKCELAKFGLVPFWATDKKKFGLKTYNARSETVHEKPSYRSAWRERRFGLVLVDRFYEPNWETGKAVRWGIKRTDESPLAIASIWERFIDKETGEIIFSFSMLTVNADSHDVMKHFHKPQDEKRSVVVLSDNEYIPWLNADTIQARAMLNVAPKGFLSSQAEPRVSR
ncbi:MAG: SOS response-associated peptidase family protein [Methylotenera sp.]|uniref:SOS response-associated peptidase n=1 Tax=Methylotenera sp. TaxID=2051956 RepID=UPI00248A6150|nr:SOS response-associated peptidase family protein [Methylotenera sp.]MDI1308234.1 SOS response-associated peptidase family protein [Methylotenera sp.]